MSDWFRRSTWSQEDEIEFFKKLKRSQKHNRPQYLRVQAYCLYETKDQELLRIAESLACKVLTDCLDAEFINNEIAPTHNLLGNIHEELGEDDKAIMHYQKALEQERVYSNVRTDAYLDYAEIIVKTKRTELFSEAEKILHEQVERAYFPAQKYKLFIILAIISKHRGDDTEAQKYMLLAKQNADADTSGLRYHKTLGLVKETDRWLEKLLK
jgi:tetratricopeptide (TPR) repeat protein